MKDLKEYLFEFLNSVDSNTITKVIKNILGEENVLYVTSQDNNDKNKALAFFITIKEKENYSKRNKREPHYKFYDDVLNDLSNKLKKYNYYVSAVSDTTDIDNGWGEENTYIKDNTINWVNGNTSKDFIDIIKKYEEIYKLDVAKHVVNARLNGGSEAKANKAYDEFLKKTGQKYLICVEPEYGDDVTDYIKTKCNNKLYHITTKENYEKIQKSKIMRIRGWTHNQSPYGHGYSKRIYFIFGEPKHIAKNISIIGGEIAIPGDLVLLEIDITDLNFKFYKDTYSENKCACYCFNDIPLKYIKRKSLKNNKILDYKEK